jgi:DNA-binding NarL/FixJ family response regulator
MTKLTQRPRDLSDLDRSERNARMVLEAIPDMVFLVDRNGIHLDYIPGQDTDPILPAKELMGRSVTETLPEAADLIMEAIEDALSGKGTQTVSYQLTYADGPHHLEARVSAAGPDEVLALVRDVTGIVRLQAELEAAREELDRRAERQIKRANPYDLTFREFTVLNLVAEGKTDKAIAADLGISPLTVHRHVSNIRKKMNCGSRTEAGTRAIREGLID